MNNLDHLLENGTPTVSVSGRWFSIQWIPDNATQERLNIGVGFLGKSGEKSFRLLDDFHRVECLYDSTATFHARLACNIAEEAIRHNEFDIGWHGSTIATIDRGFAQGVNPQEIVDRLFVETVPLAQPEPQTERRERFAPISVGKTYDTLRTHLKSRLDLAFERHVPDNPYETIQDQFGEDTLFLPFRRRDAVATLASASYADPMRVYHNLFEGFRFVETAVLRDISQNAGIFFVLPGSDLEPDARNLIENEIDSFYHFAQRHRMTVESHTELEPLGDLIAEWCEAEAA